MPWPSADPAEAARELREGGPEDVEGPADHVGARHEAHVPAGRLAAGVLFLAPPRALHALEIHDPHAPERAGPLGAGARLARAVPPDHAPVAQRRGARVPDAAVAAPEGVVAQHE